MNGAVAAAFLGGHEAGRVDAGTFRAAVHSLGKGHLTTNQMVGVAQLDSASCERRISSHLLH